MTGATFDTLEAVETLTRAGVPEPHARAIVATMRKAVGEDVATRADIRELKADIHELTAELRTIKWVLCVQLAILVAIAARLFGVV